MKPIPHKNNLRVQEICDPVSVPISANRGDQFQHFGMGMLFEVGGDIFLVTCRHVVVKAAKEKLELWVRDAANSKLRRVSADFFLSSASEIDMAVARLSDELASDLSSNRFVTQDDLFHSHQPLGIPGVMHGILSDLSSKWDFAVRKTNVRVKTASFIGRTTESKGLQESVDDKVHFLIYASNLVTANVSRKKMEMAELNATFGGLSGTPVFAVDGNPYEENWNPVDTKVIGIQSGVVQLKKGVEYHEYMKIVRIEFLHYLLSEAFPTAFRRLMA